MSQRFAQMEACLAAAQQSDAASLQLLLAALENPDWRIRYAAAIALGDRKAAAAIPAFLRLLREEDAAPLYGQHDEYVSIPAGGIVPKRVAIPADLDEATRQAYMRRGRLKQAICLALGEIGLADPQVLAVLQRYAVDGAEDYPVRAAACKALGQLGDRACLPTLRQAAGDDEWCTHTEAAKALDVLARTGGETQ